MGDLPIKDTSEVCQGIRWTRDKHHQTRHFMVVPNEVSRSVRLAGPWTEMSDGWQGLFRHVLLEVMPVADIAKNFSESLGAPTKELFSMAGLVFLTDFFDWTADHCRRIGTSIPGLDH